MIIVTSVMCSIAIAFSFIGMFGALQESYALSVIYLTLTFIDFMTTMTMTDFRLFFWINVTVHVIVLFILASFIMDLRNLMKRQHSINPLDSVE